MAMAMTVQGYLQHNDAPYDLVRHPHSACSMESAVYARIPAGRVMKSVILGDDMGDYMMVVLPANRQVGMRRLGSQFGRPFHLASEREIETLFTDCETGAIPAIGPAYGLKTILDDEIAEQTDVYFEAGDHERLVHMRTEGFMSLMRDAERARFARPM
jgi:Ala-tRNA(Pro) deacylase